MKQIAQYQDGRIEIQEVPVPALPPGGVLVRVTHSVISVGTEKMKVEQARMNLLQKARARPDQVRKVLDTARNLGWKAALEKVRNRLATPTPLGYSAAGEVEAVHSLNTRLRVGDRVACGGAECAFHAEYIAVPDPLVVRVPDGVESWQAAYTTIASIALQAVRQTAPQLGDRVLVMGQGLIGLLVTNLLVAHGARVMAVDLAAARRPFCEALGAEKVVILGTQDLADAVRVWTEGFGVDAVVVCTSTQSNAPIEQSGEALRDRGRMVIVGNTRTDLAWKVFYEKEIDVRYSRSYGPGRYDPAYEWGGSDYPIGYVRWTEQRNFEACLHLMHNARLNLEAITTRRVPFAHALEVYRDLMSEQAADIGVVLEYPAQSAEGGQGSDGAGEWGSQGVGESGSKAVGEWGRDEVRRVSMGAGDLKSQMSNLRLGAPVGHLDVVGAGNFARTMLLPHLHGKIAFGTVVNATALSANHVKGKFGFDKAATGYAGLFGERGGASAPGMLGSVDGQKSKVPVEEPAGKLPTARAGAVLIATRHHLHAAIVNAALAADRHVFVEKPLCLTRAELASIDKTVAASQGSVMVGFNRRFAPASVELKRQLAGISGPKSCTYRVVPGKLDPAHWYANYAESGGRVLGEACHFLDYFCCLFDSPPVRAFAQTTWPAAGRLPFPDSVAAQVEFADGSCGQLIYTAEGDPGFPKETLTVFGAGFVAEAVNFQQLVVHRGRKRKSFAYSSKGHAEEMAAWLAFLRGETAHPLPYGQSRQSMLLTFAVLESIQQARAVKVGPPWGSTLPNGCR